MRKLVLLWLCIMLVSVACSGDGDSDSDSQSGGSRNDAADATPTQEVDPQALLARAADLMLAANTFNLEVTPEGASFIFDIDLGSGLLNVEFKRAVGQFAVPSEVQATTNVIAGGLAIDIIIYAFGQNQWYKPPLLPWVNDRFADGFDPGSLMSEDGGIRTALSTLRDLEYKGRESINGVGTYHFSGTTDGPLVSNLLVGLIEMEGLVPVEVYLNRETGYPVRIVIEQLETATETEPNRIWRVDIYDINAENTIERPPGAEDIINGEGS